MKKIKDLLENNNLTIAVAESLTSGLVQSEMAKLPGSSSFFEGGITVYSLRQKVELLGVDESLAKECDCVSQEVAHQMSKGVANKFDADIGVATTGYAEPDIVNGIAIPFAFISVFFKGVTIGLRVQGDISMTRTKMRNFVTKEVVVNIHKIIKYAVEKQTKTIQEQVDSGELSLQTNRTEIVLQHPLFFLQNAQRIIHPPLKLCHKHVFFKLETHI